jgi:hypothetical protein
LKKQSCNSGVRSIAALAKKKFNYADALKELLFKGYLTDGEDINDLNALKIWRLGLNSESIDEVL